MCGSDRYPINKDETVGLLNSYHVSNKLTRTTPFKEKNSFTEINKDTKTSNKGKSNFFHCGDLNHWSYECPQLSDKQMWELSATKENGGRVHTEVSELVKDNRDL